MTKNVKTNLSDALPEFSTRASISSGLEAVLATLSAATGDAFRPYLAQGEEAKAERALKVLSGKRIPETQKDLPTGLKIETKTPGTGAVSHVVVTLQMLQRWWTDYPALGRTYATPAAFLEQIVVTGTKNTAILQARGKTRAAIMTPATQVLYDASATYTTTDFLLDTDFHVPEVTAPDEDFLYSHLRRNCDSIYWVDGTRVELLTFSDKTGGIAVSSPFWAAFWRTSAEAMRAYLETITEAAYSWERLHPADADGLPGQSFDADLRASVPQIILHNAVLKRRERTSIEVDDSGKQRQVRRFDCWKLGIAGSRSSQSCRLADWQTAFASCLTMELQKDKVRHIPQFSNIPGAGLSCIPLRGVYADGTSWKIDAEGNHGHLLAESGAEPPEMPPEFKRFFGTPENNSIFETSPRMCALRLADFLYRVVVDGTESRQCLVLAGDGQDGKSVFVQILQAMLPGCTCVVPADALSDTTNTFCILNAPLVVLHEAKKPSAVFSNPFFKSITGGDTVKLRQLFYMPVEYTPEHARFILTTNACAYVSGAAEVSRLLPVAFRVNYDLKTQKSKAELLAACVPEREPFLQWVCDTVAYYKALRNSKGLPLGVFLKDRLFLISDEDFERWKAGKIDFTELDRVQRRALERDATEATGRGRFVVRLSEDGQDDDAAYYAMLFDALFVKDDAACVERPAVALHITSRIAYDASLRELLGVLGIDEKRPGRDKGFKAFKDWMLSPEVGVRERKTDGRWVWEGIRFRDAEAVQTSASDVL